MEILGRWDHPCAYDVLYHIYLYGSNSSFGSTGQLGYTMTWSSNRCKLEGRDGEVFNLRIREGCPEITERDALKLIARLEDENLETLKANTKATRSRVKAAALAMSKTWFDHLISYIDGELSSEAWKAIEAAPFLQDVPRPCVAGLVDSVPETNGWDILRGLEHLNRRARKKLWASNKWLVHLYSGERDRQEFRHLENHGCAVLELDIARGRTQDVLRPSVWRVLEFAARKGKIAGIVGGSPQGSFMISRHVLAGPEPLRSNDFPYGNWPGQSDADVFKVNRETQLMVRMIYLHALSTADRLRANVDPELSREVAFLLEHPRDPRGYLKFGDPLYPDVVSFWRTPLWSEYALEAGLDYYNFDMAALGTSYATNERRAMEGPVKVGGADPDARGAFPKNFKYIFVAKLRVPKTFVEDGRGAWVDYEEGELAKEEYEDKDDGLASEGKGPADEEVRDVVGANADDDEDPPELEHKVKLDVDENSDLAAPELVSLIFSTGLRDDKAVTVLEAVQDVVLYCQSLNIPVIRFHTDRGMEFQARATKQWLKGQGIRVTTSEAGVHQTNGAAEATVRWIKQRPKLEDMAPKWTQGIYVGLSGKIIWFSDVVGVSKVTVFDDEGLKKWAEAVLGEWSQEEAEAIVIQAGKYLPAADNNYGMFRFGGRVGVTRATVERPWLAKILLRLLTERAPDAEFASVFISINNEREVHIDRNNAMGTLNYILPVVMPKRGGEIWQELRNGDVVSGRILELQSKEGRVRYGCSYPLQEGQVFYLNPHRRHAVLPWKGERLVIVGYTPGVLQNLNRHDRELLWDLGFPMPLVEEEPKAEIYINMLNVVQGVVNKAEIQDLSPEEMFDERADVKVEEEVPGDGSEGQGSLSFEGCSSGQHGVESEEWSFWEMCVKLQDGTASVAVIPELENEVSIAKAEVGFTENIEVLLQSLDAPLTIVHTVNPKEVAQCFEKWIPSLAKEVKSLEHAVDRVDSANPETRADLDSGRGQVLPMKVVYTVKPPDPPAEGEVLSEQYKRKSRIVVRGNFAAHQPGEVYTNTAPAEIVRAAIALARFFNWDLGMIDVVAAFLRTPLKELKGAPLVYGIPPKVLIKAGLCRPGELWRFTHAVYGLQESPKLWGAFRDLRLARVQLVFEGKRVTLMQGTVEPSWWSVLEEGSQLIGIIVVYVNVDDLLICGHTAIIKELAKAIRAIWKTSDLQLISEGPLRFLGMEISRCTQGYALSQRSYIEELVRLHQLPAARKDVIPISKDLAVFAADEAEGEYSETELRLAQQWAGELLWVSQRTRPDIAFTASLVGSLATRAPRRAAQIGEKTLGFLQRTANLCLVYDGDSSGLAAYCDASFAPEGGRSHTGWLVQLHGCTIAWRSGRQSTVTLSTAESELMAMSEAVLALQSVDSMMQDIKVSVQPHQLFSDSTSALAIANGSVDCYAFVIQMKKEMIEKVLLRQAQQRSAAAAAEPDWIGG
ncbi:unnamed protein product [Symbiodinium sp. CCMP2592]|nr:unnamed protein product [Symbiodinium sp. CCMP2592]